jgi:methylated-DNA-protein-cysteine methyltransferase-like protein
MNKESASGHYCRTHVFHLEIIIVGFFQQAYAIVRCVPRGRVATYGQIARMLEQPHAARTVGWAMRALPEGSDVPWHRVVNAAGRISLRGSEGVAEQRRLLEAEGVSFGHNGRIDLYCFGWNGLPEHEIQMLIKRSEGDGEPS